MIKIIKEIFGFYLIIFLNFKTTWHFIFAELLQMCLIYKSATENLNSPWLPVHLEKAILSKITDYSCINATNMRFYINYKNIVK